MESDIVHSAFRIYGDNILECEKVIDWIKNTRITNLLLERTEGTVDRPIYIFQDILRDNRIAFQLCPFYGDAQSVDWPNNPLVNAFDEKVDTIITRVLENGNETKPIIAIEFVDALMAGNQGWQRSRRALNAAINQVSYLYVQPIIGWERDSEGLTLKNPRFLPAQTCISQLTLCSKYGIPSFQIYEKSSWSEYAAHEGYDLPEHFRNYSGIDNATILISNLLRYAIHPDPLSKSQLYPVYKNILHEMFEVARTYSNFSNTYYPIHCNHPSIKVENHERVVEQYALALINKSTVITPYALHNIDITNFNRDGTLFNKDAQASTSSHRFHNDILPFINWKHSADARYKTSYLRKWEVNLPSTIQSFEKVALDNKSKLPLTYKDRKSEACVISNRHVLKKIINDAYPDIEKEVLNWIYPNTSNQYAPIFFIPMYGFKPTGDSRPDRGLIPLLSSMFPEMINRHTTLVLMYSNETPVDWKEKVQDHRNELWNSISTTAGALIVDRTQDGIVFHGDRE